MAIVVRDLQSPPTGAHREIKLHSLQRGPRLLEKLGVGELPCYGTCIYVEGLNAGERCECEEKSRGGGHEVLEPMEA